MVVQLVENPPVLQEPGFNPWVGKILWRKAWQLQDSFFFFLIEG